MEGTAMSRASRHFKTSPHADSRAIVGGQNGLKYRFAVLDSGLVRYEFAEDGIFEDRASTFAVNRNLPVPEFQVNDRPESLEIITKRFWLQYDKKEFSSNGLSVQVRGSLTEWHSKWRYGDEIMQLFHLGGTARTLDGANGRIPLGPAFIARNGFANIDDTTSMIFTDDGWVTGRPDGKRVDGYIFAYGLDYKAAMKAFYAVSGSQPLLPRYSLGNWWSRYYDYTTESYLALMDRFEEEETPLSVAVVDMGWHWVNEKKVVDAGFSGWTGYSWNTDFFPDPGKFLDELHKRHLRVTLNDHPADGIASYESKYEEACKALGLEDAAKRKEPIPFEVTNTGYLNAYFDLLLKTLEEQGVDFWWVDWQQGTTSAVKGVDPLWVLNHYHFLYNSLKGRPITFSRYAGPGSHRYPVGFSGDTIVSWDSLDFQPEFTAAASNIGYGWWSHDIGGHMHGYKDDELETRWVQLGVLSPLLRLHSNNNVWNTKEPWKYNTEACGVMKEALRLRHRLIPYIYSMNVRAARENEPLVQPVYWHHSETDEAYHARNTYFFGSELFVAPLTSQRSITTRRAKTVAWLPPGRHVDMFSGIVYDGDRKIQLYRTLDEYAVFCREGSIVPLDGARVPGNGGENPSSLEIVVAVGANGSFDLLEDDGSGSGVDDVKFSNTKITFDQKSGVLTVTPPSSASSPLQTLPEQRNWSFRFVALDPAIKTDSIKATVNSIAASTTITKSPASSSVTITLDSAVPSTTTNESNKIEIHLGLQDPQLAPTDVSRHIFRIIDETQMDYDTKQAIWGALSAKNVSFNNRLGRLQALDLQQDLMGAVSEILLADERSQGAVVVPA